MLFYRQIPVVVAEPADVNFDAAAGYARLSTVNRHTKQNMSEQARQIFFN